MQAARGEKRRLVIDGKRAGRFARAFQGTVGNHLGRVFMLIPQGEVAFDHHPGARLLLFESRADINQLTSGRNDRAMQALTRITLHAGEVTQAGSGIEVERIDSSLAHQFTHFLQTIRVLVEANRYRLLTHGGERCKFLFNRRTADTFSHSGIPYIKLRRDLIIGDRSPPSKDCFLQLSIQVVCSLIYSRCRTEGRLFSGRQL